MSKKVRNYSFKKSSKLPFDKMTEVNGVKIPSLPGSCYHAIICALSQHKSEFCEWDKIIKLTEHYMRKYGGSEAWVKFRDKKNVKPYEDRIKENVHTLTRTGKDCYGYRLHELGMAIYFFRDGAMLFTGGTFFPNSDSGTVSYGVRFNDGKGLQVRYRGCTMTYSEYKKFLEYGYIDICGGILNAEKIRIMRDKASVNNEDVDEISESQRNQVFVTLAESFSQNTADRLEHLGFVVAEARDNALIGTITSDKLPELEIDPDIVGVESV